MTSQSQGTQAAEAKKVINSKAGETGGVDCFVGFPIAWHRYHRREPNAANGNNDTRRRNQRAQGR
jgi:hypothetical protein